MAIFRASTYCVEYVHICRVRPGLECVAQSAQAAVLGVIDGTLLDALLFHPTPV